MKRPLFLLLMIALVGGFKAQNLFLAHDSVPASFRIDFSPFQFGFGPWHANTKTNMPEHASFILRSSKNVLTGLHIDLQAIFKDKVGIETGFDFVNGTINQGKIRNQFQGHIPDYNVSLAPTNNQTGESPFVEDYEFRIFKLGLVGFLPLKKIVILPYADFLYTIESYYPIVKVDFINHSTGAAFTREYKFYNTSSNGFQSGASLRCYFGNENEKRKHVWLYLQLRAEFVYLKTNGYCFYLDKYVNKNEISSPSDNFSQNIYAFVFGVTLGGVDFHW